MNLCREILMYYSKDVKKLGFCLLELLSQGLGLDRSCQKDYMDCYHLSCLLEQLNKNYKNIRNSKQNLFVLKGTLICFLKIIGVSPTNNQKNK